MKFGLGLTNQRAVIILYTGNISPKVAISLDLERQSLHSW